MTTTTHTTDINPIELLIVALLALLEGTCWLINELAGLHTTTLRLPPAGPLELEPEPVRLLLPAAPTETRAVRIQRMRAAGDTWRVIAAHYGVSDTTVRRWSKAAA